MSQKVVDDFWGRWLKTHNTDVDRQCLDAVYNNIKQIWESNMDAETKEFSIKSYLDSYFADLHQWSTREAMK